MSEPVTTILVVEDEFLIRMMLAESLADDGFAVIEAGSTDEAMGHIGALPTIGLMVTDLTLPGGMDGMGLARWVRQQRPEMPIVYVTGRPDTISASELGPRDVVLAKPYLPSQVLATVRGLLGTA